MVGLRKATGSTCLCPTGAIDRFENPTEEQLRNACLNESENPQND